MEKEEGVFGKEEINMEDQSNSIEYQVKAIQLKIEDQDYM